ncbi:MAG: Flp pilus assembly complex ATPase component [Gammaproteobacteria bacterium]|nr:Flp pilus assembly complex ATPase component [Gammaproteobacteria bacterium]
MNTAEKASFDGVTHTRIGVMTYLAPKGALSEESYLTELQAAIGFCIEHREAQIVIDLAAVPKLDSAALEVMLDAQDQLVRLGGYLKVVQAQTLVREIFDITGFTNYVSLIEVNSKNQAHLPNDQGSRGNQKLGDILLAKGLLNEQKVAEAIKQQQKLGKRMGQIVVEQGWVSEKDLLIALGEQLSLHFVQLRSGLYDPEITRLLERDISVRLKVLPLFKVRGELFLATANPQAIPAFDEVEERLNCRVKPVLARTEDILKTINDAYTGNELIQDLIGEVDEDFHIVESEFTDDHTTIDELAAGSPVINMVNSIIQRAIHDGASDIHIEPSRNKSRIRFRIDGLLYEVMTQRIELHLALVSRLKVMANLDIAERRLPQDGRIQVFTQGRSVDLRFSSLPGLFGEKVVLRVLDKKQAILDVNKLGMSEENLTTFKSLLDRSFGLILVTGPTGSGKTTSLYAALSYLNSIEKNIVTIEDPVEYQIEIVNQNEVKNVIGLSFAKMLKHVLRQDPDIVMVGEIRERETAEIAVQAALTGHLVLSTLHTNDSVGAVTRMIDMGVEPYLLSSAVIGVIAQRLVRTICESCKTSFLAPPEVVARFAWDDGGNNIRLARGRGCPECYDSGYKGRIGTHEILVADPALQRLIMANPSRDELVTYVKERELKTLLDDGLERVRQGSTTIEEVTRVVNL